MTLLPLDIQTSRGNDRDGSSGYEGKVGHTLTRRSGEAEELVRHALLTAEGARHQSLRAVRNRASGRMLTPVVAERRGRGAFLVEARGFHEQE